MIAVDCFCASGGSACGLEAAGFDVKLGLDVDEAALSVYRANHRHDAMALDLGNVDAAVSTIRAVGCVDLLSGSPPCTDFSSAGGRKERETHAGLTVSFARIAVALRTRAVLIENVPELLRSRAWTEARDLLVSAGYSVLVVRVNSAACGVAQVRRRVFVICVLGCDDDVLRWVERETRNYNATPRDAPTVRDCLDVDADTFWYAARNKHAPCVFSTDAPCPTLRCNCLSAPPSVYAARHDDAGPASEAHTLSVNEAAAIASFPPNYFDGVSKTVAAKCIGNCVPPKMMETVARCCMELLQSPRVCVTKPLCLVTHRSKAMRVSRVQRLIDAGLLSVGGVLKDGVLSYTCGGAKGDAMIAAVLGSAPLRGWRIQLRLRRNASVSDGQAPLDDLFIYLPKITQPFRSFKQLERSASDHCDSSLLVAA